MYCSCPIKLVFFLILITLSACSSEKFSQTPNGFELHPDYQLTLVASEPLVFDPVDMEFDERERAFVLEMPGYPLHDAESRLIILKDTDEDGIFDVRQVFADSLNMASSIMPYKGGILVAAPPELIFLKDTDGDEVADVREVLMEGFSEGNLQHNYNGLSYGIDNWIYAANGGNSGKPYFTGKPETQLDLRGDDFRFNLEEQKIERVGESSGGFELAFDDRGYMFETHNTQHISHLVFEDRYIEDLPINPSHTLHNIADYAENGLARIYPLGEQETRVNHPEQSGYFSGACGITFYGGGIFPPYYSQKVFVADVVLNLIHLDILEPQGASFTAKRSEEKVEFLASSDRAFRPVNMTVGPSGALYVLDMHRDVIEHPEWIPDELEKNMDLKAGREKGRIYRIYPKEIPRIDFPMPDPSVESMHTKDLVHAFNSTNQWVRMTAQRMLVENNRQDAIPYLIQKLAQHTTSTGFATLHTFWTLEGLGALHDSLLLANWDNNFNENLIQIAEKRLHNQPKLIDRLISMIFSYNYSSRTRMQAILSLSTLKDELYNKYKSAIQTELIKLLENPSNEIDTWTSIAIACATKRDAAAFTQQLFKDNQDVHEDAKLQIAASLSQYITVYKNATQAGELLEFISHHPTLKTSTKTLIIESLAEGWENGHPPRTEHSTILPYLELVEQDTNLAILQAVGKLRQVMGFPVSAVMKSHIAEAKIRIQNRELAVGQRLQLAHLISLEKFDEREKLIYQLLDNREPLALQKAALRQLWEANKANIGEQLLKRWPDLGPEARKHAGNILLYKSSNQSLLLSALENKTINLGELNLDLERRRVLLFSENEEIKKRAKALFSDAGVVQRKEAVAKMQAAIHLKGKYRDGEKLFKSLCGSCHVYGNVGNEVGPVLTEISRKSKESIIHDIVDPNAAVDTRYLNHRVQMQNGDIFTGIIAEESDTGILLRMMEGAEKKVQKKDIRKLTSLGISFMPEGLEAGMSPEDMANLLAYLQDIP